MYKKLIIPEHSPRNSEAFSPSEDCDMEEFDHIEEFSNGTVGPQTIKPSSTISKSYNRARENDLVIHRNREVLVKLELLKQRTFNLVQMQQKKAMGCDV